MDEPRGFALAPLVVIVVLVALALASAPSWAQVSTPVNETRTIHEGNYSWVMLYSGGIALDMEIDVSWNSSAAIDVWLMDRSQWDRFESGQSFAYDIAQSGRSGALHARIEGSRLGNGSMYVVLENGARGNTTPPADAIDDMAEVTVAGRFWRPEPETAPNDSGILLLRAIEVSAVVVPVAIVVFLAVKRLRRKDRHAQIRRELDAGNVVGTGTAVAPEAFAPPPPGPQGPWGSPPPGAARPGFCRSCGAPLAPGKAFCTRCGSRV